MTETLEKLQAKLDEHFADQGISCTQDRGQLILEVTAAQSLEVATVLHQEPAFHFEQLSDLCGLDYAAYGRTEWQTQTASTSGFSRGVEARVSTSNAACHRFAVVSQLLSYRNNNRLRLRVLAEGEPPRVPSLVDIWPSANWYEREAFDLFGILFEGHPDLRRILTDYGFIGHPFRKDFPLNGNVEVRYDPEKGRVVYQPVTIENRVLVPRVIRDDERYAKDAQQGKENA